MFGHRVRTHRLRLGLSQDELAQRAGVDVKTIGNIETGRTRPRPSTVRLLVDALQLDGDDIADLDAPADAAIDASDQPAQMVSDPVQTAAAVVPAQLPANVAAFTGRRAELARLDHLLAGTSGATGAPGYRHPPAVVISAVSGTAGVGKTALAMHWAHQVIEWFPDGQLYIDLRGFGPDGSAVTPGEAIRRFLDALGVPPQRIPADPDAQAALYRSRLAGRRMLVVLDNARDSGQVRPLLPGAPTCLVLVTSRNQLSGLIAADGARPINLDVLSPTEARDLLARRLGDQRVAAEPAAVAQITTRCARLPLALALVAARAEARPRAALDLLAADLADARQRWQALTGDDPHTDVPAVFSWSYQALTQPAAELFRLLGLHPGPDISIAAAASLIGQPLDTVRPALAELTRASLLTEPIPGRYACHDLLHEYARQLADTVDTDQQRHVATRRILDHYLHTAYPGARLLSPARESIPLAAAQAGVTPEPLGDHEHAMDWFNVERQVLLAAIASAADAGFDIHTWQLAWTLWNFLFRREHWHDLATVGRVAATAAQRLANPTAQAFTHRLLADAYTRLGRFDDAHNQLHQALDLATRSGDQTQHAQTHYVLSYLWGYRGQPAQALHHARQALHHFQATGHLAGQARALDAIGWCHGLLGEHQQALVHSRQALNLFQQLDDRDGQAETWDLMGRTYHRLSQHAQAVTYYRHALTLYQNVGDHDGEAHTLTHLGDTHHATGHPHAARHAWQQALTILNDLDHPDAEHVRAKLARLASTTG